VLLVVALGIAALLGCRAQAAHEPFRADQPTHLSAAASNVERGDYVGSAVCANCHPDVAAAWSASAMHRMTRTARGADIRAPFDGRQWPFGRDVASLEQRGDERFVRIQQGDGGVKSYRVTRVIGGRTREDFAGVLQGGSAEEVVLPVSFIRSTGALRYKGYSVMVHERDSLRAGPIWSRTCIFCHNTVPEMDRMLGAIAGARARAYQGEQVDPWLPADRQAKVRVVGEDGFLRAAGTEARALGSAWSPDGSTPRAVARTAIEAVRGGFDGARLVEEGIGCEACHGGGHMHASNPSVHPSLVPVAPWLDYALPASSAGHTGAQATNRVCARCHQVLFSRYPFTWEGGRRDQAAGGSHISSGEARDFLLGGCASQMPCTTCHDPHRGSDAARMRELATPAGNAACTSCHADLASTEHLRAHAHHDPAGAGSSCVGCHMPRKNMGLDGSLTRYHRIGSPADAVRVLGDRPLECALCHPGKSVSAIVNAMEEWWPVRYPRQRLVELYGSLDANVIRATLERGKAHEQAVALGVLREARDLSAAPLIAKQLTNEYPLVRAWARAALDDMGARAPDAQALPAVPTPDHEEEPED
jgi:predicted CXXCH cytochrome family protein